MHDLAIFPHLQDLFPSVIADCSRGIAISENHIQCLQRRAIAYERSGQLKVRETLKHPDRCCLSPPSLPTQRTCALACRRPMHVPVRWCPAVCCVMIAASWVSHDC